MQEKPAVARNFVPPGNSTLVVKTVDESLCWLSSVHSKLHACPIQTEVTSNRSFYWKQYFLNKEHGPDIRTLPALSYQLLPPLLILVNIPPLNSLVFFLFYDPEVARFSDTFMPYPADGCSRILWKVNNLPWRSRQQNLLNLGSIKYNLHGGFRTLATSGHFYQTKRRHVSEDINLHSHRCENLISN